jgi:hypothetical protein
MKKLALLSLALLAACAGGPVSDQPTAVAMSVADGLGDIEARAAIDSLDHKPAWARLYLVPAARAEEARAAIAANDQLGRWALIPVASASMEGRSIAHVRLTAPSYAVRPGDLLVLAIDPISPGRFDVTNASVLPASNDGGRG